MLSKINGFDCNPIGVVGEPMDFSGTTELGLYATDTAQRHAVGRLLETWDGRRFRYAKAGGTALVQALMNQSPVTDATYYSAMVQTAHPQAVGSKELIVTITTGGVAAVAVGSIDGDFVGGYLVCNKVSPAVLGDSYMIIASEQTSETAMKITLDRPVYNAWLATAELTMTMNPYMKSTVFAAYNATACANGVALVPVAAGSYYWSQTRGPAPLTVDDGETLDIGQIVGCPITLGAAGECGAQIVTTAEVLRTPWGRCMEIAIDTEPALVYLTLE